MGMLGQWIAKPRRFTDFDDRLNKATKMEIKNIRGDIKRNALWLELRDKHGFAPNPENSRDLTRLDEHIARHWYNKDDAGWWPSEPVEEIRTESLNQVIKLILASINKKKRKTVSSYWVCPGVRHCFAVICESDQEITMMFMTPPEGPLGNSIEESRNRPDYEASVKKWVRIGQEKADAIAVNKFSVPIPKGKKAEILQRFKVGHRVAVSGPRSGDFFRTISRTKTIKGSLRVSLRAAPGNAAQIDVGDGRSLMVAPVLDPCKVSYSQAGYKEQHEIYVVSGLDQASSIDADEVKADVIGAAVRRNLGEQPW